MRPDPAQLSPQERFDALAEALAEGFLYLAENGLLDENEAEGGLPAASLPAAEPVSPPSTVGEIA